jgi:adenine-specific DNA glycosylase
MYQLPLIEFNNSTEKKLFLQREKFNFVSEEIKHILSHQHLYCHFVEVHEIPSKEHTNQIWVSSIEISDFPVPRIIDKFIEEHFEKIFF